MKVIILRFVLFCLLLTIFGSELMAQKRKSENLPNFDLRRFHFGFVIGFNQAHMELQRAAPSGPMDSLHAIAVTPQGGFNLGIVSSFSIAPLLKLRFVPTLSFAQRNLDYYYKMPDNSWVKVVKPVESTYVEFPLTLKLKSKRLNNFSAYVISGGKYAIDLVADEGIDNSKNSPEDIVIKMKRSTTQFEVGTGVDFYLEYFKFGIELKMSYTLGNTLVQDNTVYSRPIEALRPRVFALTFTFEG
jgi:hypothetical protein